MHIYLASKGSENFAFKIFHDTKENKRIANEIATLKAIDNINVVRIIENFEYENHPVLIMEYISQNTLYNYWE